MTMVHIRDIDLGQLRLVEALSRFGSLGAAAHELGISQSAASHSLARLRRKVGDQIFVRIGSGMRPTPYGQRLGASLTQALTIVRGGLAGETEFNPKTSRRTFNVCMSDVGQSMLLPDLIAYLERNAPNVALKIWQSPSVAQQSAIFESGEVDLAAGYFTTLNTGFKQRRLFDAGHYVCVARPKHPAFKDGMTLDMFRNSSLALAESSGVGHAQIARLLSSYDLTPRVRLTVPQITALPQILCNSDLIAVLPDRFARALLRNMKLQLSPLPFETPNIVIKIYWHDRYDHEPGSVWFRNVFAQLFPANTPRRVRLSERS